MHLMIGGKRYEHMAFGDLLGMVGIDDLDQVESETGLTMAEVAEELDGPSPMGTPHGRMAMRVHLWMHRRAAGEVLTVGEASRGVTLREMRVIPDDGDTPEPEAPEVEADPTPAGSGVPAEAPAL